MYLGEATPSNRLNHKIIPNKHTNEICDKEAYLYKVMLQEERGSNGEISNEDASWEHLEDPGGSKISSHRHNTEGKT
jgi:hypothetical protein